MAGSVPINPRNASSLRNALRRTGFADDQIQIDLDALEAIAVTSDNDFATDDVLLASDGLLKKAKATAIDKDNVVQAAANFVSGEVIQAAGNDKTTQSSGKVAANLVTADAEFTSDNSVLRVDGASSRKAQSSTMLVSDTGAITLTDPATSPSPFFTVKTLLLSSTFEMRVYTAGLSSLGMGVDAGGSVTTGNQNIFIGKNAGSLIQDGSSNVMLGVSTGEESVSGSNNVNLGPFAGQFATGSDNIYMGSFAGQGTSGSSTANENVAIGPSAGLSITTAGSGVFIGKQSGQHITTNGGNIGIGAFAVSGASGSFSGTNNTGVGVSVGAGLTTGVDNAMIGNSAGTAITTGSFNMCVGRNAGSSLTTVQSCAFVGAGAGQNVDGAANIGIGRLACRGATAGMSGVRNVCVGSFSGLELTTGGDNMMFGDSAGRSLTSGSNNVYFGRNTGNNASQKVDASNTILIGNNLFAEEDNIAVIGTTSTLRTILRGTTSVDIQSGTNAQHLFIYNTFTASDNFERLAVEWTSNIARIETEKGAVGGTARALALGTDSTSRFTIGASGDFTIADGEDFILNATTGTKIGTATTQKLGFWNATPIVQPAAANQAAITNSTGGTGDGTLAAVAGTGDDATINNNFTDIHELLDEIRTALVNSGLIKGAA